MADLESGRRKFLVRLMGALGCIALLEASWIAVSSLTPNRRTRAPAEESGVVVAGRVDHFPLGSVTPFAKGRFHLVRDEDGGFLALHRKCTHLGCSVPWKEVEQRFTCPCHASAFDIHGDIISVPAPRPLDLFAVTISKGVVSVDTMRAIRRKAFAPEQVVRA